MDSESSSDDEVEVEVEEKPIELQSSTHLPYGFRQKLYFIDDRSALNQCFQIRTLKGLLWNIKTKKIANISFEFIISLKSDILRDEMIKLEYQLTIPNHKNKPNIELSGEHIFDEEHGLVATLTFDKYDEVVDTSNGYFGQKGVTLNWFFTVKECRYSDSIELINLHCPDAMGNDYKITAHGVDLYVSKLLLTLQSKSLRNLFESDNPEALAEAFGEKDFESIYDFLQLAHGVDIALDDENFARHLALAIKLDFPRIREKCKNFLIYESSKSGHEKFEFASEFEEFWDVGERVLEMAKTLTDIREQKWRLEASSDVVIKLVARRVFEVLKANY